jgi:probable HAF family extracellular repeat protein
MNPKTLTRITVLIFFVTLTIPVRLEAQQQPATKEQRRQPTRYTVIDLGPAGSSSNGINDHGDVAGTTLQLDGVTTHAFLWRKGVTTDLGTIGGPDSNPFFGPSERGQVVGQAETSSPDPLGEDFCAHGTQLTCLPFLWHDGVMMPLPTLGGNNGSGYGMNNRGDVVGTAENAVPDSTCTSPQVLKAEPVIWEKGEARQLPTISDDPDGVAFRINDRGQVVGASTNCIIPFHAVLWQRNARDGEHGRASDTSNWTVTDLGNLGGAMNNVAEGINDQGIVVGFSDLLGDSLVHAFIWKNGTITDLGTVPGGDVQSLAFGINNKGQVVGLSCGADFDCVGFLWEDGVMTDLNTLAPADSPLFLSQAYDINSRGEIVGLGDPGDGTNHTFLAIPCDEHHADAVGCENQSQVAIVTPGATRRRPKAALPENVRKLLRQPSGLRH